MSVEKASPDDFISQDQIMFRGSQHASFKKYPRMICGFFSLPPQLGRENWKRAHFAPRTISLPRRVEIRRFSSPVMVRMLVFSPCVCVLVVLLIFSHCIIFRLVTACINTLDFFDGHWQLKDQLHTLHSHPINTTTEGNDIHIFKKSSHCRRDDIFLPSQMMIFSDGCKMTWRIFLPPCSVIVNNDLQSVENALSPLRDRRGCIT